MTWPGEWKDRLPPTFPVRMHTERDEESVRYDVTVSTGESVYEGGEDERTVWTAEVRFGLDDWHRAGGGAFKEVAARQQQVADAWVAAIEQEPGRVT